MSIKKQKEGVSKVIILSALEEDLVTALLYEKELYGLDILKKINDARRKENIPELSIGSLYPTLKRLSEAGLIKSEWRETVADGNSPRRKYYSLQMEGEIAIKRTRNYRKLLAPDQKDFIDDKVWSFQPN